MSVRVRIPTPLRAATDGVAEVQSDAGDVLGVISELETRYPAIKGRLLPALSSIIVTRPLTEAERQSVNWMTYRKIWDTRNLLFYYRLLPDNRILFGARGGLLASAALFDPINQAFSPTRSMITDRDETAATLLPNGKVLIGGGVSYQFNSSIVAYHAKAELYDPVSGTFSATGTMSEARAAALGLKPLGRFVAYATAGCPPEEFGIGPVYAIPKALKLAGLKLEDIAVIELNEAFAAQSLAVIQQAGLDAAKVNPNGGAIALGHPLGCTGAKLTATILRDLARRGGRYGMVTMCIGGGMGAAGIIERL